MEHKARKACESQTMKDLCAILNSMGFTLRAFVSCGCWVNAGNGYENIMFWKIHSGTIAENVQSEPQGQCNGAKS